MKLARQSVITIISLLLIMLLLTSMSFASGVLYGHLNFKAETVYYEGNTLVVHGSWHNQTNKYIDHTNWVTMNVFTWNGSFWEMIASGTFAAHELQLAPGQWKVCTYRIYNTQGKPLGRWWVQGGVSFHTPE